MLLLIISRAGVRLVQAELGSVPAVALEVLAELDVLVSDGILANIGNEEVGDESRQQRQRRGDPEGILGSLCGIIAASCFDMGEDPSSDKGTNLANGSSNTVITTTNTSGAGLGGQETNVVAGTKLSKAQENTIDNGETSNVLGDLVIDTGHDVADNRLQNNANDKGVLGADVVADKGTNHSSRNVEQVDDGVPPENGGEGGGGGVDARQDRRGVDTEGVRRELGIRQSQHLQFKLTVHGTQVETDIVEEPNGAHGEQSEAVVAEDQQVGCLVPHGLLVELIGLLESETEDEQDEGEDDTDSERSAPDGAEAAVVGSSGNDVYDFRGESVWRFPTGG